MIIPLLSTKLMAATGGTLYRLIARPLFSIIDGSHEKFGSAGLEPGVFYSVITDNGPGIVKAILIQQLPEGKQRQMGKY